MMANRCIHTPPPGGTSPGRPRTQSSLLRNPRAKEVQESGSGRGTRASRRARGLWKLPQPCKWEWWPSADFLLIISTAACKSLRLYHVSHRRDGERNSQLRAGILIVVQRRNFD